MSDIKLKIKRLLNLSENGATEGEKFAALNAAQRLMRKHQITESDIPTTDYVKQRISLQTSYGRKWVEGLMSEICNNNHVLLIDCHNNYILFGTKENIEISQTLYTYCFETALNFGKPKVKQSNLSRYKFWSSYGQGFLQGVIKVMRNITQETQSEGLILLSNQQLRQAYKEQENIKLKTKQQRQSNYSYNTFASGFNDGNSIKKSITNNQTKKSYLLE